MVRVKEFSLNETERKISQLWMQNPDEWKQYHVIRDALRQRFPELKNLSERTIMRYFSQLVEIGFFEKKIEPSHRTWYRPKAAEFRKTILKDRIEKLEDPQFLQDLDTFSLFLLKALNDAYESSQETPGFLEILESVRSQFLKLKQAQETIKRAAGKINQQKAKRE